MNKLRKITAIIPVIALIMSLSAFMPAVPASANDLPEIPPLPPISELKDADFAEDRVIIKLAYNPQFGITAFSVPGDYGIEIASAQLLNPSADVSAGDNTENMTMYSMTETQNDIYSLTLESPGREAVLEALEILNNNPLIELATPCFFYYPDKLPNDYLMPGYSYAFDNIFLPQAWEITTGSKDVVIGIIDTGIDGTHPDIAPNLWNNPDVNPAMNDVHGYDFFFQTGGTPFDKIDHGTMVASVAGAKGNNNFGYTGVNWDVSLAWLGAYNPDARNSDGSAGSFDSSALIAAVNYATNKNIPILNNSYGGDYFDPPLFLTVARYNGLFVASCGNERNNNDVSPRYPANYALPNVIAVAATDSSNNLWVDATRFGSGSNYGKSVHIAAPGANVVGTSTANGFFTASGTSMSAPIVSGIAALCLAAEPSLTTDALFFYLTATTQDAGNIRQSINPAYGGLVNAYAAVELAATYGNNIDPVASFVTRLYRNVLGREADKAGLDTWVRRLKAGEYSGSEIAYGFYFSIEFLTKPVSNEEYIDNLYATMMDRDAGNDPEGKNHWLTQLDSGMSRDKVLEGFLESTEFAGRCNAAGINVGSKTPQQTEAVRAFVWRLYNVVLGRPADAGGINAWTNRLISGEQTGSQVARGFFFGEEYESFGKSDDAFVDTLYQTVMGRSAADDPGRYVQVERLTTGGWSRGMLFDDFAGSAEFAGICQRYGIKP